MVELVYRFRDRRYLFAVGEGGRFAGLITYADLNKSPVYAICYVATSERCCSGIWASGPEMTSSRQ